MKINPFKRVLSVLSVLTIAIGLVPQAVTAAPSFSSTGATAGESLQNPILISSMDQLIEEMEKNTKGETYYKLTDDVSHETSVLTITGSDWKTGDDGFTTVREPEMAQCVVGTGKKFLELDGYDIHYKNNVNFNHANNSKYYKTGTKYDSLTFFYLGEGCDLTVTNSTGDDAEVWYDGWMHNRTNLFFGPNYIYTAVRDVFRVEAGAELTVNNTDIKAGRNRKIWMVNSFYLDKDKETNLIASLTWNGFAYEQIYGSAIVANGGTVTVNGGYIEGRGGYRNEFNVTGLQDWDTGNVSGMIGDWTTDDMIKNCLSNVGAKAAVQIAGEGSTVIINDGEFWGCGGANVIGINGLNGGSVKEYTLRINAGTFDTSKTDKERVPDRNAGSVNDGPWTFSALVWDFWANCRAIRDTLRGNIGIPAVDGYGNNVFNTKMVHVYIDDEEPEDECIDNADLDFRYKSDSDTIIVKPRAEKDYWHTDTYTWNNYADRAHYQIYAYLKGEEIGGKTLYYGPAETTTLYFSAESHYDMTDEDNPYFDRAHLANCKWVLYEEDKNGNLLNSYERVSASFHTEHKDGHTVFNFKIPLSYFTNYSAVAWNEEHTYYMVAYMEERFDSNVNSYESHSYTTGVFQDWENGVYDGDGVLDFYYNMGLEIVYGKSLATCGAEVVYSNAVYGNDPVLTFNDAFNEMKVNGTEVYQWQVLEGDTWVDHGNYQYSPELAVDGLLKHQGLTGKLVRLKITPEYGDERPIYSNVCTVQKDQNTSWPTIGVFSWESDPDNTGKYIAKPDSYNDAQEWLIYTYDKDRDLSTLNWKDAADVPEFNNLKTGVYTVYSRFKETDDYEAGTEIGYSKIVVGPYTAAVGISIVHNDNPVQELLVKVGEEFTLTATPLPAGATVSGAHWTPQEGKENMLAVKYRGGNPFLLFDSDHNFAAKALTFKALKMGNIVITAETELEDKSKVFDTITVRVVPDNYIPYTVSVVNKGAEIPEGGSFVPQLALHARIEMLSQRSATKFEADDLSDSDIKTQLQSDTIKKQLRDKITWALVNPVPQLGGKLLGGKLPSPYTESTVKASINNKTGEITLKDAAKPGDAISFVGILDDPYLGKITVHGSFTVVAAPEPEVHTCDYEGYSVIKGNLGAHYRVCECGNKKTENHSYTKFTSENAGQTVSKYVCPCGLSYSETVSTPVEKHVHAIEYACDDTNHWEICTDEDCPDEYSAAHQTHSFVPVTDEDGRKGDVCSVCGWFDTEPEADTGTEKDTEKDTETVNPYADIKADDWYYNDVMYVTDKKLMNGNNVGGTLFDPNVAAARAMIVTVLWRLEGSPNVVGVNFDDVASGQWYTDAVNWASANGIVNGYGNGKFGPSDPITREQLLAILHRYASFVDATEDTALTVPVGYKHSDWSKGSIAWSDHIGLLDGLGIDVSDLLVTATRSEIAAYLHRFCENILRY